MVLVVVRVLVLVSVMLIAVVMVIDSVGGGAGVKCR